MRRIRKRYSNSVLLKSFRLIEPKDRTKTVLSTVIQVISGLLDLLGVAMIGALGALTISGLNSKGPGDRLNSALKLMGLEGFNLQKQITIIGVAAVLLLLGKTFFSAIFTKKTIRFLSRISGEKSAQLLKTILESSYLQIKEINSKELSFAIRWGARAPIVGIVGAVSSFITDGFLAIILFAGLFLVDPVICLAAIFIFASIGTALYWSLNHKARFLGTQEAKLSIKIDQEVSELLGSLKELIVRQRVEYYYAKTKKSLSQISDYQAQQAFLPLLSKYVIETAIVLATILVVLIEFITQDTSRAIATTTVFFAAASRIAPAILRMQQSLVAIKGNIGVAQSTIELFEKFQLEQLNVLSKSEFNLIHTGFSGDVKLDKVSYSYPGNLKYAIKELDFQAKPGEFIGITGISGAGKSTLVNLILGLIEPTHGTVLISGLNPREASEKFPGAVSYVPQEIYISDSSVRENITLGFDETSVTSDIIEDAIKKSSLEKFILDQKEGLSFMVGEQGNKISGGERQRLGIARALITNPKILILDEATSSLDGVTEAEITNAIEGLAGDTTIIVIAHRLSTVKNADRILFLKNGEKVSEGTFTELRRLQPDFRTLCEHMGL
jgi:ATP-binding cassette subfamily C protein